MQPDPEQLGMFDGELVEPAVPLEEFEDFESDELDEEAWEHAPEQSQAGGLWDRHGFSDRVPLDQRVVLAHGMVTGVIQAFARDGAYRVVFSAKADTAATNMNEHRVEVSTKPLHDQGLSVDQAAAVMTGFACHEISHPRFGRKTFNAIERAFPKGRVAHALSNILDDIRIERRFVAEYPGYAGIFKPTLKWVAESNTRGTPKHPVDVAAVATRYDEWYGQLLDPLERQWWKGWAGRWAREDAARRHVMAVREALQHIANRDELEQAEQQMERELLVLIPMGMPGEGDGSAPGKAEPGEAAAADAALSEAADAAAEGDGFGLGACLTELGRARRGHELEDDEDAQGLLNELGDGQRGVSVQIGSRVRKVVVSRNGYAERVIRASFLRARDQMPGDVERFLPRGRLDQRQLYRLAAGISSNVFSQRNAPQPRRVVLWMLADTSGSMTQAIDSLAEVTYAIANASRSLEDMRMGLWGWTTGGRGAQVTRVWASGQPTSEIFRLAQLPMGGTPDEPVLRWATDAIRRETTEFERPVLMMMSDGLGYGNMAKAVLDARHAGVDVVSVALGTISETYQRLTYGEGNYITWPGSMERLARPLAALIGALVTGKSLTRSRRGTTFTTAA